MAAVTWDEFGIMGGEDEGLEVRKLPKELGWNDEDGSRTHVSGNEEAARARPLLCFDRHVPIS